MVLPLARVQDDEVDASAIERGEERRPSRAPDREQIGGAEVDGVVVAGDVDELRVGAAEDALALGVAGAVGLGALVLDVVAEVDDEVRLHLAVHPRGEAARQLPGVGGELAQLAAEAGLGAEVQIGDEREGEVHQLFFDPPRQAGEVKPSAWPVHCDGAMARMVSAWTPFLSSSERISLTRR